jgi:hypothetical protein
VGKAIYAIEAFPDDAQLWRIDWIGGVAYNASVPSEPLIDVCLARLPKGETNPLSARSRSSETTWGLTTTAFRETTECRLRRIEFGALSVASAWTLCENRPPLLATDGLRANLYAQRPDAGLHWLAVLEASYLTIAQSKNPDRGTLFPDDIQRADHRRLGQNSWLPRHAEDSRALDGSAGGNGGTTGILPLKC